MRTRVTGLKAHQISNLVSSITRKLYATLEGMPQSLREYVSRAVIEYLESRGLFVNNNSLDGAGLDNKTISDLAHLIANLTCVKNVLKENTENCIIITVTETIVTELNNSKALLEIPPWKIS